MLGDGGQDVNRQLVRVGIIHRDKLHPAFHEGGDEREIARRSSLLMTSRALSRRHASWAFASSGRSFRLITDH
jgi:hypothetical protein